MKAYQMGDYAAFQKLHERHSGRIFSYLRNRIHRKEVVEEVYQMVFMKLHKSKESYDPTYPFIQWLFVLTKSVLLDYWRKQTHQVDVLSKNPESSFELPQDTTWERKEKTERALPALEALSPMEQEVVNLRVINELSYQEIARRMNQSQENVRQIVSRTLNKLRKTLKGNSK